ncbi:hypothetical protein HpBT344_11190 [Helicobacter pylori]
MGISKKKKIKPTTKKRAQRGFKKRGFKKKESFEKSVKNQQKEKDQTPKKERI